MNTGQDSIDDIGEITGQLPHDPWNELYEQLLMEATEGGKAKDIAEARVAYFRRTGDTHGDDADYNLRMALFLDWYTFNWRGASGTTPVQRIMARGDEALQPFATQRHSLFSYIKGSGPVLKFKDLIADQKINVQMGSIAPYFTKDEFFEARLLETPDGLHLAGPICQHAGVARKIVEKFIKTLRKEFKKFPEVRGPRVEALLLALRELRVRSKQYSHVDPTRIYREGLEKLTAEFDGV